MVTPKTSIKNLQKYLLNKKMASTLLNNVIKAATNYTQSTSTQYYNSQYDSFTNDSQTGSSVRYNLLNKIDHGETNSLNDGNMAMGVNLNSNPNEYTVMIDSLDMGDLLKRSTGKYEGSTNFLEVLNTYKNKRYKHDVKVTQQYYLDGDKKLAHTYTTTKATQSIFNPYYAIKSTGTHTNQPLNDIIYKDNNKDNNGNPIDPIKAADTSDCSIWALLKASAQSGGRYGIGTSIFRLADFMYCKDLGKVSNNHLITLRRYTHPVGDNIYHLSNTSNSEILFSGPSDVGRLVTWFGTDDNKLSDILNMSFHATWRELNSEIQEVESKADSEGTGIFGMIANTLNPSYNRAMGAGITGNHNLFSWLGSHINIGPVSFGKGGQYENSETLRNYDKHKVYEPKNTIQSNHVYEGKILFEHEFTLNFAYKIRSYGDLNQKSAMNDLIHNILAVTFTKGKFWGGAVKMIGAPGNNSAIKKMDAFIDNAYDKLAGFTESVLTGAVNWQELMASLSESAAQLVNKAFEGAKAMLDDPSGTAKKYGEAVVQFAKEHKFGDAIKGALKNTLGRPAVYAINSLVPGENLGLWHVTIGNPLNPIASIGNLILTNAQLSFGDAPLGLDDFPTEIRVAVTLKHCKPRDMTDIGRMFTRGETALALPIAQGGWSNYIMEQQLEDMSLTNYRENLYQQQIGTSRLGVAGANAAEMSAG